MDMTSLADPLFTFCESNNKTIYFLGSTENEITQFVATLKQKYDLRVIGYRNGYIKSEKEKDEIISTIISLKPDILLVGMGSPLQEIILTDISNGGWSGIGFTCGGFFHQTIHETKYYPQWIDVLNLRFMYRIYKEKHTRALYFEAFLKFPLYIITDTFHRK